jgi:hypothetical protein
LSESIVGFAVRNKTAIISVQDLTPEAIPALRQALSAVAGVKSVDFQVARSVAVIEFDSEKSHVDDFLRAVLQAGYKLL